MASKVYNICIVAILVYLLTISNSFIPQANAAGKGGCGNAPAASLIPCLGAAKNGRTKVPPACCGKIGALLKTSPKCLCAALLSPAAKNAGVNPAIAVTIPKRCNIKNRPVGKRCGRYVVP
ncbi:non-specific lipid transfer protein GPI-anchored 15-like [Nicotiana tabacum]|uniref:Non-specific lipid transfer protein GPI-anchored 15-like n=2 Tax=Nicotiana TaxID=4085 RepID=A0A1S3ZHI1_TOBAC|nr:PREDICTED: non-specific lipid-transfer protein 1 [Nicotiana sylvestris]XP_016463905.1 PREDICTED: non-specific lipid-transfer protein 1-like [Nicotiana tabacum]